MKKLIPFFALLLGCPPVAPPAPIPAPDASDASPPIYSDAMSPCDGTDCCGACAGLLRAGCMQSDCVPTCTANEKYHLINFNTVCLAHASTPTDVKACGVSCTTDSGATKK
jgi:hypothetical protein